MLKSIQTRIANFAHNRTSSSLELAKEALSIIRQFCLNAPQNRFHLNFKDLSFSLLRSQPAMASVIQVVNRACLIMEEWGTKERQTVLEALKSLETEFDKSIELTISNAVAELEGFKSIATYSRSYLVEQTLLSLAGSGSKPKITLSQSQPGMEGITLGEKLHQAGLAVTLCIDAALPQALKAASTFILGADAIFQHQFCNKIGSEMMCLSARNTGLPVYVIASPDKFLPAPLDRFFKIENPLDVGIDKENSTAPFQFNQLFELANIEYVDYIISDKILSPGQIRPYFHASPVAKILTENYD